MVLNGPISAPKLWSRYTSRIYFTKLFCVKFTYFHLFYLFTFLLCFYTIFLLFLYNSFFFFFLLFDTPIALIHPSVRWIKFYNQFCAQILLWSVKFSRAEVNYDWQRFQVKFIFCLFVILCIKLLLLTNNYFYVHR